METLKRRHQNYIMKMSENHENQIYQVKAKMEKHNLDLE